MRKKSGLIIVEQAIVLVPEFENVVRKMDQQVTLCGQAKHSLNNDPSYWAIVSHDDKKMMTFSLRLTRAYWNVPMFMFGMKYWPHGVPEGTAPHPLTIPVLFKTAPASNININFI